MKTLLTTCILTALFVTAQSQDNDKKFRFGLKMTPSFNWLKIDDTKTFEGNGAVMKFGYGLITEFNLTGTIWFSTGLQVDYDGGRIRTTSTDPFLDNTSGKVFYQYDENKGLAEYDNTDNGYKTYWLRERTYRTTYITLPIQLRMKTKEIGMLTYFGNIGINASFQAKTRVTDVTNQINSGGGLGYQSSTTEFDRLVMSDDMNPVRLGLVIGGGAEMNLSGSTSLLFGLHFFQGFTNTVKKESKYLLDGEKTTAASTTEYKPVAQEQKFLNNNITITVGVLF
ncbi:MAG TPA: porin family protein [Flavobacteriales bacterium]|nr:porin family protein [Flavobacteriales bacterium]